MFYLSYYLFRSPLSVSSKGRAIDFSNQFDVGEKQKTKIDDMNDMMSTKNIIADKDKTKIDSKGNINYHHLPADVKQCCILFNYDQIIFVARS